MVAFGRRGGVRRRRATRPPMRSDSTSSAGRRLFKSGYQYYASRGEMFICHPGGLSSGVYQCWRINALTNNAADLTVSTTYNIGDCSASFRCVKNYENF